MSIIIKIIAFVILYCVWVMVALAGAFRVFGFDPPGLYLGIVVYLVAILIPVWLFAKVLNWVPRWTKQVLADGKQATATIVGVKDTGVTINRTIRVVKLQLRVEPPGDTPFEVSQDKQISLFSGLGGFHAGNHLQVKYDPDNKKHIVILSDSDAVPDYGKGQSSGQADPELAELSRYEASSKPHSDVAQELSELAKLHKSGDLSDSEFEAAKKKLLS